MCTSGHDTKDHATHEIGFVSEYIADRDDVSRVWQPIGIQDNCCCFALLSVLGPVPEMVLVDIGLIWGEWKPVASVAMADGMEIESLVKFLKGYITNELYLLL